MDSKMKDSGIEWVGQIPSNWEVIPNKYIMHKIKEICLNHTTEDILSLSKKGVMVRNFEDGGKMPATFDGYQKIFPGNLLMCLFDIDVTPRCVGIIKNEGLTSPAYTQFVLNDDVDVSYFYYYYLMLDEDKTLVHLSKNLRHSITEDQLGNISVIKPPLKEQKKISNFLNDNIDHINNEINKLINLIEKYKEYKQTLITEVVTTGLNKDVKLVESQAPWMPLIPEHWKTAKFKFHLQVDEKKGFQDLEVLSLYRDYGVIPKNSRDDNHNVTSKDTSKYKHVVKGNFVVNKMKAWQGSVAVSEYEGIVSPAYYVYKFVSEDFNWKYFHYLIRNKAYTPEFRRLSGGVRDGQWDLSRYSLENMIIFIPPINEQNEIVKFLDKKCALIDSLISQKIKLIDKLEEYKKSLIFEYVTGKKEVPK